MERSLEHLILQESSGGHCGCSCWGGADAGLRCRAGRGSSVPQMAQGRDRDQFHSKANLTTLQCWLALKEESGGFYS